jgi:hypothetical protein
VSTPDKRLSLRFEHGDRVITDTRLVPGHFIDLSHGDVLGWERDALKREFGAALVDFLDIEIQEENYYWPRVNERNADGGPAREASSSEDSSDNPEGLR